LIQIDYQKAYDWLRTLSAKKLLWAIGASFLLASGISMYMSYLLIPQEEARVPQRTLNEPIATEKSPLDEKARKVILERNIFNSDGELGDALETPKKSRQVPTGQLVESDLPLKLKGVIFAGDPFNGLAMIENEQKRRTMSYIVGDMVINNARLIEVYDDRVILERNGRREYIELEEFAINRSRRKAKAGGSGSRLGRIASRPPPGTYREEGFERDGMDIKLTEEFKRSLLSPDRMAKVLQDAKAEPNMVNGELRGFRLTRIRESSIYEKAGFQNGDVVEEINGIPLRDAAGAIRLLQQLRSARDIEVRVNRGGVVKDMNIQIQ
jgi:general secretion pathway protein C